MLSLLRDSIITKSQDMSAPKEDIQAQHAVKDQQCLAVHLLRLNFLKFHAKLSAEILKQVKHLKFHATWMRGNIK